MKRKRPLSRSLRTPFLSISWPQGLFALFPTVSSPSLLPSLVPSSEISAPLPHPLPPNPKNRHARSDLPFPKPWRRRSENPSVSPAPPPRRGSTQKLMWSALRTTGITSPSPSDGGTRNSITRSSSSSSIQKIQSHLISVDL